MPFAAAGGLGDVIGSLPAALRSACRNWADIRVALPLYGCIDDALRAEFTKEAEFFVRLSWRMQPCCVYSLHRSGVLYYFIENDYYFDRENIYGYPDDGERFAFFPWQFWTCWSISVFIRIFSMPMTGRVPPLFCIIHFFSEADLTTTA